MTSADYEAARAAEPDHRDTDPAVVRLTCPSCRGPVYVPGDSDRERVDCAGCRDPLVTLQGVDGVSVLLDEETIADRAMRGVDPAIKGDPAWRDGVQRRLFGGRR